MEGWVNLVDLIVPWPGVEPATFRSRVRHRTTAPLRQPISTYMPHRPNVTVLCWIISYCCYCVVATLSQATCLLAVGDFVYVATTFGCLVVIDSNSLTVSAVCQPTTHIGSLLPLTTDQSRPADVSRDQPAVQRRRTRLMVVGQGYSDLIQRTVSQYRCEKAACDGSVLLVWSDSEWISHAPRQSNVKQ